jgi:hypothetical protein
LPLSKLRHFVDHKIRKFGLESAQAKAFDATAYKLWPELTFDLFESADRLAERLLRLRLEEQASTFGDIVTRRVSDYCFECSSVSISDDGPAVGLHFHRYEPKIFLSGEKKRATTSVVFAKRALIEFA